MLAGWLLWNFRSSQKILWQSLIFNKVASLRPATLLKKRLCHSEILLKLAYITDHIFESLFKAGFKTQRTSQSFSIFYFYLFEKNCQKRFLKKETGEVSTESYNFIKNFPQFVSTE